MPNILDGTGGASSRSVSAVLFLTSAMTTLDAYSTLNSSPWTSENFGADPEKAKSCREYVVHAIVFSLAYSIAGSVIAGNAWPLVGTVVTNAYLYWLYDRALKRGAVAGSNNWAKG